MTDLLGDVRVSVHLPEEGPRRVRSGAGGPLLDPLTGPSHLHRRLLAKLNAEKTLFRLVDAGLFFAAFGQKLDSIVQNSIL